MKYWIIGILCYSFHLLGAQSSCPLVLNPMVQSRVFLPLANQDIFSEKFDFGSAYSTSAFTRASLLQLPNVNHLPSLFCKLEYKLETKSKLAPRFRLGSLQYSNWMEGKGEYFDRYY